MTQEIESRIKRVIAKQIGTSELVITDDKKMIDDLGTDSLDAIELVMALEDEFYIEISDDECSPLENGTVKEIIEAVKQKMAA